MAANGREKLAASVAAALLLLLGSGLGSTVYKVYASHEARLMEHGETLSRLNECMRHIEGSLKRIEDGVTRRKGR
jgi:3-deoxy-D-arabino-heptulosonate 7-phosphate (DAHP) synthase class II